MPEGLAIRPERAGDHAAVARIHDAAFGGPDEARIVDAVRRDDPHCISLVAEQDGAVVGHVLFSRVTVRGEGSSQAAIALGPVGVDPARQRGGIGRRLCDAGLDEARRRGERACLVLGHADYYPRHFGFEPARPHGLFYQSEAFDAAFFALALTPGGLEGLAGEVVYHPAFS